MTVDIFEDMPILRRKWQAALKPGEHLPPYEEVMLGSLGRLVDHIVLLTGEADAFAVSRSGRYAQQWLGDERWNIPLDTLPPDCATALSEAASNAVKNNCPYQAVAHCVRDGMVRTYKCSRCRRCRAGAARWSGPTSTSAAPNTICWMRSFPPPKTA
jgi:hypothetical protein